MKFHETWVHRVHKPTEKVATWMPCGTVVQDGYACSETANSQERIKSSSDPRNFIHTWNVFCWFQLRILFCFSIFPSSPHPFILCVMFGWAWAAGDTMHITYNVHVHTRGIHIASIWPNPLQSADLTSQSILSCLDLKCRKLPVLLLVLLCHQWSANTHMHFNSLHQVQLSNLITKVSTSQEAK